MKVLIALFISITTLAGTACPNRELEKEGFNIHPGRTFKKDVKFLETWIKLDAHQFILDVSARYYSTQYNGYVKMVSLDFIPTRQSEMFGDVVFIKDLESGETLEVRWYDNKSKHISYNRKRQSCASSLIPMVDNALF